MTLAANLRLKLVAVTTWMMTVLLLSSVFLANLRAFWQMFDVSQLSFVLL